MAGSVFNYHLENADSFKKNHNLLNLPQQMLSSLYEFQQIGIKFGVNNYGWVLLGDEMGVGKTI